jgi:glucose/mannose transport system substrate-binding protein
MQLDARLGNGTRSSVLRSRLYLGLVLSSAALSCSENPETVRLEVYSWWEQPEEKVAFDAVARMHMHDNENVDVRNLDNPDAENSRQEMSMRMLASAPPATFQANIGADVLRWAVVDYESDAAGSVHDDPDSSRSLIHPLADLFTETGLTVPPELEENLRVGTDGGPFAVPLNIHRVNVLYYNRKRRDDFELASGKKLLDIRTLCPADAKDPNAAELGTGFAFALASPWTLILLVFENILPALVATDENEDPDFYEVLFRGQREGALEGIPSTKVDEALACAQYLSRSLSGGRGMDWAAAVRSVADTHGATFAVMGDWANPLLEHELSTGEVVATQFPGTEELFIYTSDTFPLPIGVDHPEETIELLKTFASADAQIRFSLEKGSIPARLGVNFSSPPGWSTSEQFMSSGTRKLLATSGYFPPYYSSFELERFLATMMTVTATGSIDPNDRAAALRLFTDLEPVLWRWRKRLSGEPGEPTSQ